MKDLIRLGIPSLAALFALSAMAAPQSVSVQDQLLMTFMETTMNAEALVPRFIEESGKPTSEACGPLQQGEDAEYRSASDTGYSNLGWERRIAARADFFSLPRSLGRILVIDYAQRKNGELGFRYLSNGDIDTELYEPWSSSKIMAFTGAVMTLRQSDLGASASIGNVSLADLITSVNSYEPTNNASGDSNAIASFLANVAGRDTLTSLFHDDWLRLSNSSVRFRGAYSNRVFEPTSSQWVDGKKSLPLKVYAASSDDPGYQTYRCDECGKTGNKPMTLLAQAEWLKRLATHQRVPDTRHPNLTPSDVNVLFYGDDGKGGMSAGISHFLYNAIVHALDLSANRDVKIHLDNAFNGNWRVFQKIGWGPSETRGNGEVVMLAHVCLPMEGGSREFTIAAQTSTPGEDDLAVSQSGLKMQDLLENAIKQLITDNTR